MGPGDRVLILSTAYSVVPNILTYLNSWTKGAVQFVTVPIEFPVLGAADFVAPVQAALDAAAKEGHPFRLAVFSHISSVPAVVLPVEELATICAAAGVRTFIDGAHAVGQITVDMTALEKAGVTYYTGNGHKWIYSPKGSAFLWSTRQKDAQAKLAPPVISSEAGGGGGFEASFLYTGTRDYTAFVAMGDALKWREDHGGDAVINGYVTGLSHWAEVYLCKRWGTQPIAPPHMTAAMSNPRLPNAMQDAEVVSKVQNALLDDYDSYVVMVQIGGVWYARLSAQVYLGADDFIRLADNIDEILSGLQRDSTTLRGLNLSHTNTTDCWTTN
jgi:selenocysteine lyase/cysteine desulfurase